MLKKGQNLIKTQKQRLSKMPKPMKQKDDYSCGPVAIYNALAVNGRRPNMKQLREGCLRPNRTKTGLTTYKRNFLKTLRASGIDFVKIPPHNISDQGEFFVFMTVIHENIVSGHYVYVKDGDVFNLDIDMGIRVKLNN